MTTTLSPLWIRKTSKPVIDELVFDEILLANGWEVPDSRGQGGYEDMYAWYVKVFCRRPELALGKYLLLGQLMLYLSLTSWVSFQNMISARSPWLLSIAQRVSSVD